MRKIWSLRKDKDKRRSLVSNSTGNHGSIGERGDERSISDSQHSASKEDVIYENHNLRRKSESKVEEKEKTRRVSKEEAGIPPIRDITALARSDFDNHLVKHGWVNVALNQTLDMSEKTMKLYRAELKGSHLYLYRAPSLNAGSFRLTKDEQASELTNDNQSIGGTSKELSPTTTSQPESSVYALTFLNTEEVHPELQYDFEEHQFLKDSTVPALVHFMLFSRDAEDINSVEQLIALLPLFPKFSCILDLIVTTLQTIYAPGFEYSFDAYSISQRIMHLLGNISDNFYGLLLKSDTAPQVVKLLELSSSFQNQDQQIVNLFVIFKKKMLEKQRELLELVTFNVPADVKVADLSANVFLYQTNLIEFANAINTLELRFFRIWNSSLDKTFLLHSPIADSSQDVLYKKNPLFFHNSYHIHYLARLFINHIFLENHKSEEKLARLVEKWIDLGCLLEKFGNMSAWLGIASIILSMAILRLTKVWSLVSPDYIKLLKNDWSPVLFELDRRYIFNTTVNTNSISNSFGGVAFSYDDFETSRDSYHIIAPRGIGKIYPKENVIPYFGDLSFFNSSTDIKDLQSTWKKIQYSFNRWSEYLSSLSNSNEIIRYNYDVLKRYDDMDYIFSNESLNHVLYLGVNSENEPDISNSSSSLPNQTIISDKFEPLLLKLIEVNCDSMNLAKIMSLSLKYEPATPEAYISPESCIQPTKQDALTLYSSTVSLHSSESVNSYNRTLVENTSPLQSSGADLIVKGLPHFNNDYFKIKIDKYDELYHNEGAPSYPRPNSKMLDSTIMSHFFVVDKNLCFRIDDFVSDLDSSLINLNLLNELDDIDTLDGDDDEPGLGIDVDDLLNSQNYDATVLGKEPRSPSTQGSVKKSRHSKTRSLISSESASMKFNMFYVPKYATIDKLIDLLLIDSRFFNKNISINLTEYRIVFLLSCNSFMSTKDLLEILTNKFTDSGNAVISIMKRAYILRNGDVDIEAYEDFPNWSVDSTVGVKELGDVDYELLLKIQINILKVLILLLNNFYSNFTGELINQKLMVRLLKLYGNEILQWYNSNKIDEKLEVTFASLVNYYKKLKRLFVKKTYRAPESLKFDKLLVDEFKFSNVLHEVPINRNLPNHRNIPKVEKFLHKFNRLLTVFYKGIKPEDWFKVYNILEFQYEKGTLYDFNLQSPSVSEDKLIVSNIFSFLESLIYPELKQLTLKIFPLVFRKLFKLYFKFRTYILLQITDPNISNEERLDRMKTVLIMLRIAKLKMRDNQFVFEGEEGSIPLCIESALTNVIYLPEIRSLTSFWIKASNALSGSNETSFDDINQLIPQNIKESDFVSREPLLPCFGWIIENILLVNRCPNFYKELINFNKRYLVYKLVMELGIEDDVENDAVDEASPFESKEFEFLLNLDESLAKSRTIRDLSTEYKDIKLFKGILKRQQKILSTDYKIKHSKENTNNKNANSASSSNTNTSSMHTLSKKGSNSSLKRQSFTYKSSSSSRFKISSLFGKARPFSLNTANNSDRVIGSHELPNPKLFVDSRQKPYMVISLMGKKIFPVYLLLYAFKIDSDSQNDEYLFQAPSEVDLNDWLTKLNYNCRHWFYSKILNLTPDNFITFGVPIDIVCGRDRSYVPSFLLQFFDVIEKEGINDVGIYRISSSVSDLSQLKLMIDKYGRIKFEEKIYDSHALASCIKSYFRELPDALLTDKVILSFINSKDLLLETDDELLFKSYQNILKSLPKINYETLRALSKHLNKVAAANQENKMTASNLATVIGPALTEASSLDCLINNFGYMNTVVEKLITHHYRIFEEEIKTGSLKGISGDDKSVESEATLGDGKVDQTSEQNHSNGNEV